MPVPASIVRVFKCLVGETTWDKNNRTDGFCVLRQSFCGKLQIVCRVWTSKTLAHRDHPDHQLQFMTEVLLSFLYLPNIPKHCCVNKSRRLKTRKYEKGRMQCVAYKLAPLAKNIDISIISMRGCLFIKGFPHGSHAITSYLLGWIDWGERSNLLFSTGT